MSNSLDRARAELIKAKILRNLAQHHRERDMADMTEASRRGRLLESEPDKPLPDVPRTSAASASWTRHERARRRRCGLLASDHGPLHHHPRLALAASHPKSASATAMTDFAE
jgi:hypothetical protein